MPLTASLMAASGHGLQPPPQVTPWAYHDYEYCNPMAPPPLQLRQPTASLMASASWRGPQPMMDPDSYLIATSLQAPHLCATPVASTPGASTASWKDYMQSVPWTLYLQQRLQQQSALVKSASQGAAPRGVRGTMMDDRPQPPSAIVTPPPGFQTSAPKRAAYQGRSSSAEQQKKKKVEIVCLK